ncbi:MAG: DUF4332 domain-containing protein [Methanobacteriota archaeon]
MRRSPVRFVLLLAVSTGVGTALAAAPTAPDDVDAESAIGHVLVSFSPPGSDGGFPLRGYRVYRSGSPEFFPETPIHEAQGTTRLVEIRNAPKDVLLYYAVSAFNADGEGPLSHSDGAVLHGAPPLVDDLRAEAETRGIRLTWRQPQRPFLAGAQVWRFDEGSIGLLETVAGAEYLDSGVTDGVIYGYLVTTYYEGGAGLYERLSQAEAEYGLVPGAVASREARVDSDGDGTRDREDEFPFDATRTGGPTADDDRPWLLVVLLCGAALALVAWRGIRRARRAERRNPPIGALGGLSEDERRKLTQAGVARYLDLARFSPRRLSEATGIAEWRLSPLIDRARLMRMGHVGPRLAGLLVKAGIRSPHELALWREDDLAEFLADHRHELDAGVLGPGLERELARTLIEEAQRRI